MNRLSSVGHIVISVVLLAVASAGPAAAQQPSNDCEGSAEIGGVTYRTVRAPNGELRVSPSPVVVPDDVEGLIVPFSGLVGFANTNFRGEVSVVVGGISFDVEDWASPNPDDVRATFPGATHRIRDDLPSVVGLVQVKAFHEADGGRCELSFRMKLNGSVLSTPLGLLATFGLILSGVLLLLAGLRRRGTEQGLYALGVIFGLLFGLFLALTLQQWSIRPLDTFSLFAFPIFFMLVGIGLAYWAPFRYRDAPPEVMS